MPRLVHVLTLLFCVAAVISAQGPVVFSAVGAAESYLAKDPSAQFLSADAGGLTFRTAKGMVRLTGPNLAYQDGQGKWQPVKPQIASDNAGGWKQTGASTEVSLVGGGPSKRLKIGRGANSWELDLQGATLKKNNEFTFTVDGQPWRLQFLPNGAAIETTVTAKQGAKTYTFRHYPGGSAISIDKSGNLVVGNIRTTRAMMLGANKYVYPCSAWTANRSSAAFVCDDRDLPASALPYVIDPITNEVNASSLDCDGTMGNYRPSWLSEGDYTYGCFMDFYRYGSVTSRHFTATFNPGLPTGATVTAAQFLNTSSWTQGACTMNVSDSRPGLPAATNQLQTLTYTVDSRYGNEEESQPQSCYVVAGVPTLSITYVPPLPTATYSSSGLVFGQWGTITVTPNGNGFEVNRFELDISDGVNTCPILVQKIVYGWGYWYLSLPGSILVPEVIMGTETARQADIAACSVRTEGGSINYQNGLDVHKPALKINNPGVYTIRGKFYNNVGDSSTWLTLGTLNVIGTVANPTFSPAPGTYSSPQSLTLSTSTPGATIRYTTNGSDPSPSSGTVYGGAFSVDGVTTVKAIAYRAGWVNSGISFGTYTITKTITVTSSPTGRSLIVDGAGCTTPCVYQWAPGSTHTIGAATQSGGVGMQYAFGSWSDSGAASHPVTGPASATTYIATFATQYQLTTSAGTGGTISPAAGWHNAGTVVSVSASPSAGYQFSGFSGALTGATTPQNLTMNAAASVSATFSLQPVTISVASSPSGRSLTVDGAGCTTPCNFSWTPGTSHTIAAATQAGGAGTQYAFVSWSDSGAFSHSITTPSSATTYVASFTTQYYLTTSAGTGGTVSPTSGWYNIGASVPVSATPSVGYVFSYFSGALTGSTTPQNLMMSAPATVSASFSVAPVTITISSSPAGRSLTVDGSACTAPCVQSWAPGSNHTIAAATQAGGAGTQYVFGNWSDTGAASHSITAPSSATTYTANFTTQYYLTTSAGTGGAIAPASGWYNSGAVVSVSATPSGGYQFSSFSGGLTGSTTPQNLTMSAAKTVTASFAQSSAATPSMSPAPGTFTSTQSVTLTSATSGAAIRYTTDGSTPTSTTGSLYSGPIAVNVSTTIKAIAYLSGWLDSPVASGSFNLANTVPTFTPTAGTYTSAQSVTISAAAGASIRYTTDGSLPSSTAGTIYPGPVTVAVGTTLKAVAYRAGWTDSAVGSAVYSFSTSQPMISIAPGTYTSTQTVLLTTTTPGASIRYTTNGSTPTSTTGTIYSNPITVSSSTTLKAIAYLPGWVDSTVASAVYTITGTVATPTFSIAPGLYTSPQTLTIATTTSGASIRYTTDGSVPTATTGNPYTGVISVTATTTLKAIAYLANWNDSAVAAAAYTITGTVETPTMSPAAGSYNTAQTISLSSATPGVSIRYSTDGSTPTATTGSI